MGLDGMEQNHDESPERIQSMRGEHGSSASIEGGKPIGRNTGRDGTHRTEGRKSFRVVRSLGVYVCVRVETMGKVSLPPPVFCYCSRWIPSSSTAGAPTVVSPPIGSFGQRSFVRPFLAMNEGEQSNGVVIPGKKQPLLPTLPLWGSLRSIRFAHIVLDPPAHHTTPSLGWLACLTIHSRRHRRPPSCRRCIR